MIILNPTRHPGLDPGFSYPVNVQEAAPTQFRVANPDYC